MAWPGAGDVGRDPRWRGIADHQHRRRQHGKGRCWPGPIRTGGISTCIQIARQKMRRWTGPTGSPRTSRRPAGRGGPAGKSGPLTSGLNRAASTWVGPSAIGRDVRRPGSRFNQTRCGWALLAVDYNVPREGIGGLYSAPISKASANPSALGWRSALRLRHDGQIHLAINQQVPDRERPIGDSPNQASPNPKVTMARAMLPRNSFQPVPSAGVEPELKLAQARSCPRLPCDRIWRTSAGSPAGCRM